MSLTTPNMQLVLNSFSITNQLIRMDGAPRVRGAMTKSTQLKGEKDKMHNQKINGKRKTGSVLLVVLLVFAFVIAVFPAIKQTCARLGE